MAINKKLIHFKRLEDFNTKLNAGEILDTSIVFIKDAKLIWTHGEFYGEGDIDLSEYVTETELAEALNKKQDRLTPPNNEIWYTTIEDVSISFNPEISSGVNVVSNIYENGKGIIKFDGPVITIEDSAFRYKSVLTTIVIPDSVTSIGEYAFAGCSGFENFIIPKSVTSIGNRAFAGCTSLTSIVIPDNVTEIGEGIFFKCTSLASVTIGNGITSIRNKAFYGCTSLTSITIPDSVTSIKFSAFYGCRSLTRVTIPNSVTEIGYSAFECCRMLKDIYCKSVIPPHLQFEYNTDYRSNTFDDISDDHKFYVPIKSVNVYKNISDWNQYADDIVGCVFEDEALVSGENIKTINGESIIGNGNIDLLSSLLINTTYSELKSLRDNGELVPGTQYRITDYITTTVQKETQSAGHQFDVIVTADDESTLNENAKACLHDGDTYFANCDLAAWELKYRLDNDDIFAWADTDGKGVIYYMKDEHNNECGYDFKNIQYIRTILNGQLNKDNGENTWVYTFNAYNEDDKTHYDATVIAYQMIIDDSCNQCNGNIIKKYVNDATNNNGTLILYYLNNNVFLNLYSPDNNYYFYCRSNSFGNNCYGNSFGNNCYDNSFGNNCYGNSFGNNCYDNSFGNNCRNNSFENDCWNNSFGDYCRYISSGIHFCYNSFGNNCYDIDFVNTSRGNSFGNNCSINSFGNDFCNNSFGNSFCYNSFGYYCMGNSFGNSCWNNSFENYCNGNSFGNNCSRNLLIKYTKSSHFDDDCSYIELSSNQTISPSNYIKNVNINRGVCGINNDDKLQIYIDDLINSETEINVYNVNGHIYILKGPETVYKVTYKTLINLRDNAQLIPGLQYRIIDYVTTTTQENTHSVGNQFDIIVTAIDEQTLSEDAKAIHNADNDYFNDCNLSAWELKYCLDNDINRFAWSTYINLINSSDISIKSELVNDNNEFNAPFKPTAYMYVDTTYSYGEEGNKDEDYIYEYGYETNPDGVDDQLCLFKSDNEIYPDEGADYMDKFFYAGTHDIDGVTYDKWRKAEINHDGNHVWVMIENNPQGGIYILTEQITTGNVVVEEKVPGGNGKGVIYYMKDEHDNECPYDFKNIQFKRYKITSFTNPDIVNSDTMPLLYAQESSHGYGYEVDMDDYIYCYTFASNQTDDNEDLSVTQLCDCKLNKIEKHVLDDTIKISLNNNVFFYHELPDNPLIMKIKNNYFMHGSHHNTFICGFYGNNIQRYFRYNIGCVYYDNVVSNYVEYNLSCTSFTINTLEQSFNHNIIGTKCVGNKFGVNAKNNIIGSDCQTNEFGIVFQNNVISTGFYRNRFTNNTSQNNFGTNFKFNNCAANFRGNTFGSNVAINTFGEQCINNTFGSNIVANTCHSNTRNNIVGANFTHNIGKFAYSTFGNNVHADVENGAFITACDFGNSSYFNLQVPSSASTENYVKNLKLCNVNGTASAYVNITVPTTNQDYELKVAKNSNGELKIYCEADLIA